MTFGTAGGHRVAAFRGRAVQAAVMCSGLGIVAGAAIDKLEFFRMSPAPATSQVCVTVDAGQIGVNR